MIPATIPPVCRVPGCKQGSSILDKQGDKIAWMLTCRRHHAGMIPRTK